jgi:hypothetical protein
MTFSYDLSTDIGKVRLIISDKNLLAPVFTDEEIQVFLTAGGTVNLASAAALEAWAASYAANASSETIGDYAYQQRIVQNMLETAKRLRDKEAETPAMDWAEMDLVNYGDTEEDAG